MARNENESGAVKIPSKAWPSFKKALQEARNVYRDAILQIAVEVQEAMGKAFKGKRNVEFAEVRRFIDEQVRRRHGAVEGEDAYNSACWLIEASIKQDSTWRTRKITQAMLTEIVGPKATSKTLSFSLDFASVTLNNELRTVYWSVHENKRAVERSRNSHLGLALFRLLSEIDYGSRKDSGGVIVGNDEYNRDNRDAGGGANYITATFGPAGKEAERRL